MTHKKYQHPHQISLILGGIILAIGAMILAIVSPPILIGVILLNWGSSVINNNI